MAKIKTCSEIPNFGFQPIKFEKFGGFDPTFDYFRLGPQDIPSLIWEIQ